MKYIDPITTKVMDDSEYTNYKVILPSGHEIQHESISMARYTATGALTLFAMYNNGAGYDSEKGTFGAMREILEAKYEKGQYAALIYVCGAQ